MFNHVCLDVGMSFETTFIKPDEGHPDEWVMRVSSGKNYKGNKKSVFFFYLAFDSEYALSTPTSEGLHKFSLSNRSNDDVNTIITGTCAQPEISGVMISPDLCFKCV